MVAVEAEGASLLPGGPHRPDRLDVLPHPWHRRLPGCGEAAGYVGPHLSPQSKREPSSTCLGKVPCDVGGDGGRPREGDRDPRLEVEIRRRCGGDSQRQEGVVRGLNRDHAVEPDQTRPPGPSGNLGQRAGRQRGVNLHVDRAPDRAPRYASPRGESRYPRSRLQVNPSSFSLRTFRLNTSRSTPREAARSPARTAGLSAIAPNAAAVHGPLGDARSRRASR